MSTNEYTSLTIEVDDGAAPEQVAADLLRAAFSAVGAVPNRGEDGPTLGLIQSDVANALRSLGRRYVFA